MNGRRFWRWPTDPITFFTNIFCTCNSHNTAKLMQSIEHSSLSKALVAGITSTNYSVSYIVKNATHTSESSYGHLR